MLTRSAPQPSTLRVRPETELARSDAVERVVRAIWEQPADTRCLDDLAEVALFSRFHFARMFRRVTGVPPGRFQAAVRMHEAKRLLLTSSLRVTDVCLDVGYQSLGTFSTHFSDLVGFSPRRLRELADAHAGRTLGSLADAQPAPALQARGVWGWITAPEDARDWVALIGLFPQASPEGHPAACAIAQAGGHFVMDQVPDGHYVALAVALPQSSTVLESLLPDDAVVLVGASAVSVRGGRGAGVRLELVARRITDPPIVLAVPLLLAELTASTGNRFASNGGRPGSPNRQQSKSREASRASAR